MVIYDFVTLLIAFRRMAETHLDTTVAVDDGSAETRARGGRADRMPPRAGASLQLQAWFSNRWTRLRMQKCCQRKIK